MRIIASSGQFVRMSPFVANVDVKVVSAGTEARFQSPRIDY